MYRKTRVPVLAVVGRTGLAGINNRVFPMYRLGINLSVPLWDGGHAVSLAHAAEARAVELDAQARNVQLERDDQQERALVERRVAEEQLALADDLVAISQRRVISRLRSATTSERGSWSRSRTLALPFETRSLGAFRSSLRARTPFCVSKTRALGSGKAFFRTVGMGKVSVKGTYFVNRSRKGRARRRRTRGVVIRRAIQTAVRNPVRSLLTMLGLAIGVAAFLTVVSLGMGARSSIMSSSSFRVRAWSTSGAMWAD